MRGLPPSVTRAKPTPLALPLSKKASSASSEVSGVITANQTPHRQPFRPARLPASDVHPLSTRRLTFVAPRAVKPGDAALAGRARLSRQVQLAQARFRVGRARLERVPQRGGVEPAKELAGGRVGDGKDPVQMGGVRAGRGAAVVRWCVVGVLWQCCGRPQAGGREASTHVNSRSNATAEGSMGLDFIS